MSKVTSDGSTASYYELPEGAKELQHLISYRNMNGQLAEIFRACYRYGIVSHSDQLRDAKKMVFYAMAEVERLEKWALLADLTSTGAKISEYDRDAAECINVQHFTLNTEAIHAEPSTEDMTDPRNWRAWDWVECVEGSADVFTSGRLYRLRDKCQLGRAKVEADDEGFPNGMDSQRFRFHARPDADGWIKWEGGECPVRKGEKFEVKYRGGAEVVYVAHYSSWNHLGDPDDIIAYRPHLATKHDKG